MSASNVWDQCGLISDELFDFDYSAYFDLEWSSRQDSTPTNEPDTSTFNSQIVTDVLLAKDGVIAKSTSSNKCGSKLHSTKKSGRSKHLRQQESTHQRSNNVALTHSFAANIQRKKPLYVFPSFDKCDSLVFFPSALARHLNSDDMPAMSKLVAKHLDKDCKIRIDFCPEENLNTKMLIKLTVMLNELQPDRVLCVHSTKVVENQIRSSVYFKSTESAAITDGVTRSTKDPLFASVFHQTRNECLKERIRQRGSASAEEEHRLCELIDSTVDLLVYVHLDMIITFDDLTKKITGLSIGGVVTSLHPVVDTE